MKKYARVINEETKLCEVGLGTNIEFYQSIGMTEMDVEHAYNGDWYVAGYAPEKPAPTHDEQSANRKKAYIAESDPISAHISYLQRKEQTPEIVAEIAQLEAEQEEIRNAIKERYPYYENKE